MMSYCFHQSSSVASRWVVSSALSAAPQSHCLVRLQTIQDPGKGPSLLAAVYCGGSPRFPSKPCLTGTWTAGALWSQCSETGRCSPTIVWHLDVRPEESELDCEKPPEHRWNHFSEKGLSDLSPLLGLILLAGRSFSDGRW